MTRTFFVADTHFGHSGIIRLCNRPFSSVSEMDECMIANWNAIVRPSDTVWHVGDFAYRCDSRRIHAIFDRLHGQKHLVIGNHDTEEVCKLPWTTSPTQFSSLTVEGNRIVLSHYGMRVWPLQNRGAIQLYGHSHGRLTGTSRSLDVGVDCWQFMPVDLPQIRARLAELPEIDPEGESGTRS